MNALATMTPAPQHMRALERANEVRLARAELKRQVADGETTAREVILSCPVAAVRMTLAELLLSQHRWGDARCRKLLAGTGISETKALGSLTERQRRVLADLV